MTQEFINMIENNHAEMMEVLKKILQRLPDEEKESEIEELKSQRDNYYNMFVERNESTNYYYERYIGMIELYEKEKEEAKILKAKLNNTTDHA